MVVNTCGWIAGTGLQLLQSCLHRVQPELVVQLEGCGSRDLPAWHFWDPGPGPYGAMPMWPELVPTDWGKLCLLTSVTRQ